MPTKKTAPKVKPIHTLTIGEYIDHVLTNKAYNGDFGGVGCLRPADVASAALKEYLTINDTVRFLR